MFILSFSFNAVVLILLSIFYIITYRTYKKLDSIAYIKLCLISIKNEIETMEDNVENNLFYFNVLLNERLFDLILETIPNAKHEQLEKFMLSLHNDSKLSKRLFNYSLGEYVIHRCNYYDFWDDSDSVKFKTNFKFSRNYTCSAIESIIEVLKSLDLINHYLQKE